MSNSIFEIFEIIIERLLASSFFNFPTFGSPLLSYSQIIMVLAEIEIKEESLFVKIMVDSTMIFSRFLGKELLKASASLEMRLLILSLFAILIKVKLFLTYS